MKNIKEQIRQEILQEQHRKLLSRMKQIGKLGGLASKKNGTDYRKLALMRHKKLSTDK